MSAIHTGSMAVVTINGRAHFFGTSHDHAVTGWEAPEAGQDAHALIPAQRAGSAYEQAVLGPNDEHGLPTATAPTTQRGTTTNRAKNATRFETTSEVTP